MSTRLNREEARRLLAMKAREGLSYAALAEQTGLNPNTLAAWASRLRRESRKPEQPSFVELVVEDDAESDVSLIEIVVDGRISVRIRRGFDADELRSVLAAVTSC